MSHTVQEKAKLIARVRRLTGQMKGIERALEEEQDSSQILQQIASCRGAMAGLMCQVLEGHVWEHVLDHDAATTEQHDAADDLISILRTYIK